MLEHSGDYVRILKLLQFVRVLATLRGILNVVKIRNNVYTNSDTLYIHETIKKQRLQGVYTEHTDTHARTNYKMNTDHYQHKKGDIKIRIYFLL